MNPLGRSRKPSPSMIVAIAALIVALAGTGYAAVNLPKKSVGAPQLKKNAVTKKKVKRGAITAAKLADGAVTESKLAGQAVGADKIKAGAVGQSALADASVGSAEIVDGSVGATEIAGGSVGAGQLAVIPAARARASLTQTVPTSTNTTVNLSSAQFDATGMFDAAQKGMVIDRAGIYQLAGAVGWAANANGSRHLRIKVNTQVQMSTVSPPAASGGARQNVSGVFRLEQGDVVTLEVFQTSGGDLDTAISEPQKAGWLSLAWLGN